MPARVPADRKISPPMRPSTVFAAASLCLAALPCRAQGVPSNPFASNYPSAAPSRAERAQALPARRRSPPRRSEPGPIPPASIPGERGGAAR